MTAQARHDGRWRPMTRALLSWAIPALRVALGAAVVALALR